VLTVENTNDTFEFKVMTEALSISQAIYAVVRAIINVPGFMHRDGEG
jgi:hypothetical protein